MNNKERFSNRVDNYVKYRPSYPKEALDFLYSEFGLTSRSKVADVGSGTGIFTKLLLERGTTVYAVEPNNEMRQAAEHMLSGYDTYISCNGSAEDITLPDSSVDVVVSAQAFHWFDIQMTKREFARILKTNGRAALVWNRRIVQEDGFSFEYEHLLNTYAKDYGRVNHTNLGDAEYRAFFKDGRYEKVEFANQQLFNYEQLKGRLLSSSYTPLPEDETYQALMESLKKMYDQYNINGIVSFDYSTEIFYGMV